MRSISFLLALTALAAPPDPRELVRRSVAANDRNWKIGRTYTFLERDGESQLDAGGKIKSYRSKTWDVTPLEGSPYLRLVRRDDQPLSTAEVRKEEEKLHRNIEERRRESEAARTKRVAEYEKQRERERAVVREVTEAFDFRILGEEQIDSRRVWRIGATPRPGYEPRDPHTRFLVKFRGTLWIDELSEDWVKLEAEAMDTVSWGLFILRLEKGSRLAIETTRVNNEVWLPRRIAVTASARIGLIKRLRIQEDITWSEYRKFQTDSRIVPAR